MEEHQGYSDVKRQHSLQQGAVCRHFLQARNSPRLRDARDDRGQLTTTFVLRARKQPPRSIFGFSKYILRVQFS